MLLDLCNLASLLAAPEKKTFYLRAVKTNGRTMGHLQIFWWKKRRTLWELLQNKKKGTSEVHLGFLPPLLPELISVSQEQVQMKQIKQQPRM